MGTKKCSKCKQTKTLENFCKNKVSRDGLDYNCRDCKTERARVRRAKNKASGILELNTYRTEDGFLSLKYSKQKTKSVERGHKPPSYSLKEFKQWAYQNNFKELFKVWKDSNYKTEFSPSVDRLIPRLGYSFSNIRLTIWSENQKYNHYCRKNKTYNNKNMSVKLSKLWGSASFTSLSSNGKLLYLYLTTHNNLSVLGVLSIPMDLIFIETGLSINEVRDASTELIKNRYLHINKYDNNIYFIVPAHFNTVAKSDSSVLKIRKELKLLPAGLVKLLDSLNINTTRKVVVFNEPTPTEVMDYALELGYKVDAEEFISFYRNKAEAYGKKGLWVDGRGKQVKDWRAKLRVVWCKDENKLKTVDGAPKGYESFYIEFEGKSVFPESWKDGKPFSKNMVVNKALIKEYEKRKRGS